MATITYPDGSSLASTALTVDQIQTAFQIVTANMLGLTTDPFQSALNLTLGSKTISVQDGTVTKITVGMMVTVVGLPTNTFVTAVDYFDQEITVSNAATATSFILGTITNPQAFNSVRIAWQIEGQPGPSIDADTVTLRCTPLDTEYGRMMDVTGGDNGAGLFAQTNIYTRAWRTFWTFYGPNSLDHARAVRSALVTIQFTADYLETFSLYVNPSIEQERRFPENFQARWWERVDLFADFNEQVTETFTVGYVRSVEVKGYTKDGQFTDFTVTS